MIVKFLNDKTWNYITGVKRVENKSINSIDLMEKYREDHEDDNSEFMALEDLASLCVFQQALIEYNKSIHNDKIPIPIIYENLIDGNKALINDPAAILILHLEDGKIVLITNQQAYLMNGENGQTIESFIKYKR